MGKRATAACAALTVVVGTGLVPAASAAPIRSGPVVTSPAGVQLVHLGSSASSFWGAVNDSNDVAGAVRSGATSNAARWHAGVVTTFGSGTATNIDAAGGLYGNATDSTSKYPAIWSPSGALHTFAPLNAEPTGLQSASGNGATAGYGVGGNFYALPPSYAPVIVSSGPGGMTSVSINNAHHVAVGSGLNGTTTPYLIAGGTSTALKVAITSGRALNDNDDVAGSVVGGGGKAGIQHPNGSVTILPPLKAGDYPYVNALNDEGDAVGQSAGVAVAWIGGAVHTVVSMLPAGSFTGTLFAALDINNSGSILVEGTPTGSFVPEYYLLAQPAASRLAGTALHGTDGMHVTKPVKVAAGVVVSVVGVTDTQKVVSTTTQTNAHGAYTVTLPNGTYTVKVEPDVCIQGLKGCVSATKVRINGADRVLNLVAPTATLGLTITPKPATIVLVRHGSAVVPRTVVLSVTVKNTGRQTITGIALQALLISWNGQAPVPSLPLRPLTGPTPKSIASLKPGKSAVVVYRVTARGAGSFVVEAIAIAHQAAKRVVGVGKRILVVR
jgi:hypothetical protein